MLFCFYTNVMFVYVFPCLFVQIINHLSLVDTSNSEVEAYLNKVLNSTSVNNAKTEHSQDDQQHVNGDSENKTPPKREAAPVARSSSAKKRAKSTHDALAEIFKKIGSKENTREVRSLMLWFDTHPISIELNIGDMNVS